MSPRIDQQEPEPDARAVNEPPIDGDSAKMVSCIPRLRRYARALLGDPAAADDLVQDTLERAWTRRHSWRGNGDMRAWLFSIMHNLHVDQRRRQGGLTVITNDEASAPPARATQEDALALRDLDAALAMLPAEQREVLLLVALEDMSYNQIALTLDISIGTVMSRLSRGREKLRLLTSGGSGHAMQRKVR
jgi:RNA polymerase sigma-70 factor (ECF subfamily)